MFRARLGTARLLAVLLPANMLWVFFACTLSCIAAVEPACAEHERGAVCCVEGPEAPCAAEAEISQGHAGRCAIVAVERGVLASGDHRPRLMPLATPPPVLALALTEPDEGAPGPLRLAHAPPRPRPLDRLPTLLI